MTEEAAAHIHKEIPCAECAGLLTVIDHITKEREQLRAALQEATEGLGIYHRQAKRALGIKV